MTQILFFFNPEEIREKPFLILLLSRTCPCFCPASTIQSVVRRSLRAICSRSSSSRTAATPLAAKPRDIRRRPNDKCNSGEQDTPMIDPNRGLLLDKERYCCKVYTRTVSWLPTFNTRRRYQMIPCTSPRLRSAIHEKQSLRLTRSFGRRRRRRTTTAAERRRVETNQGPQALHIRLNGLQDDQSAMHLFSGIDRPDPQTLR